MNAKEVVKLALTSTHELLKMYVSDLSDADLTVRPVPNANNIAWQLGHLIASEDMLKPDSPGAVYPELPPSFKQHYGSDKASATLPGGYRASAHSVDRGIGIVSGVSLTLDEDGASAGRNDPRIPRKTRTSARADGRESSKVRENPFRRQEDGNLPKIELSCPPQ